MTSARTCLRVLPFVLLLAAVTGHLQAAPKLDVPYVPTPQAVVQRMLELADVQPDDYVIDLGSGDGRIAISAVKDFRAREALGVDIDPDRVREAKANAEAAGVQDRVRFEQGDLFEQDISGATVLTMYLLPRINLRLRPVILDTLEPGTRVVSHAFMMDDWNADETANVDGNYVFLWIVPAKVDGRWQLKADGKSFELELQQRFQQVEGTARIDGQSVAVEGRLRGRELQLDIGGRHYAGQVDGDRIQGVGGEEAVAGWSAERT